MPEKNETSAEDAVAEVIKDLERSDIDNNEAYLKLIYKFCDSITPHSLSAYEMLASVKEYRQASLAHSLLSDPELNHKSRLLIADYLLKSGMSFARVDKLSDAARSFAHLCSSPSKLFINAIEWGYKYENRDEDMNFDPFKEWTPRAMADYLRLFYPEDADAFLRDVGRVYDRNPHMKRPAEVPTNVGDDFEDPFLILDSLVPDGDFSTSNIEGIFDGVRVRDTNALRVKLGELNDLDNARHYHYSVESLVEVVLAASAKLRGGNKAKAKAIYQYWQRSYMLYSNVLVPSRMLEFQGYYNSLTSEYRGKMLKDFLLKGVKSNSPDFLFHLSLQLPSSAFQRDVPKLVKGNESVRNLFFRAAVHGNAQNSAFALSILGKVLFDGSKNGKIALSDFVDELLVDSEDIESESVRTKLFILLSNAPDPAKAIIDLLVSIIGNRVFVTYAFHKGFNEVVSSGDRDKAMAFLNGIPLFRGFSPDDLKDAFKACAISSYEVGEKALDFGNIPNEVDVLSKKQSSRTAEAVESCSSIISSPARIVGIDKSLLEEFCAGRNNRPFEKLMTHDLSFLSAGAGMDYSTQLLLSEFILGHSETYVDLSDDSYNKNRLIDLGNSPYTLWVTIVIYLYPSLASRFLAKSVLDENVVISLADALKRMKAFFPEKYEEFVRDIGRFLDRSSETLRDVDFPGVSIPRGVHGDFEDPFGLRNYAPYLFDQPGGDEWDKTSKYLCVREDDYVRKITNATRSAGPGNYDSFLALWREFVKEFPRIPVQARFRVLCSFFFSLSSLSKEGAERVGIDFFSQQMEKFFDTDPLGVTLVSVDVYLKALHGLGKDVHSGFLNLLDNLVSTKGKFRDGLLRVLTKGAAHSCVVALKVLGRWCENAKNGEIGVRVQQVVDNILVDDAALLDEKTFSRLFVFALQFKDHGMAVSRILRAVLKNRLVNLQIERLGIPDFSDAEATEEWVAGTLREKMPLLFLFDKKDIVGVISGLIEVQNKKKKKRINADFRTLLTRVDAPDDFDCEAALEEIRREKSISLADSRRVEGVKCMPGMEVRILPSSHTNGLDSWRLEFCYAGYQSWKRVTGSVVLDFASGQLDVNSLRKVDPGAKMLNSLERFGIYVAYMCFVRQRSEIDLDEIEPVVACPEEGQEVADVYEEPGAGVFEKADDGDDDEGFDDDQVGGEVVPATAPREIGTLKLQCDFGHEGPKIGQEEDVSGGMEAFEDDEARDAKKKMSAAVQANIKKLRRLMAMENPTEDDVKGLMVFRRFDGPTKGRYFHDRCIPEDVLKALEDGEFENLYVLTAAPHTKALGYVIRYGVEKTDSDDVGEFWDLVPKKMSDFAKDAALYHVANDLPELGDVDGTVDVALSIPFDDLEVSRGLMVTTIPELDALGFYYGEGNVNLTAGIADKMKDPEYMQGYRDSQVRILLDEIDGIEHSSLSEEEKETEILSRQQKIDRMDELVGRMAKGARVIEAAEGVKRHIRIVIGWVPSMKTFYQGRFKKIGDILGK